MGQDKNDHSSLSENKSFVSWDVLWVDFFFFFKRNLGFIEKRNSEKMQINDDISCEIEFAGFPSSDKE